MKKALRFIAVAFFALAATPAVNLTVNSPAYWGMTLVNTVGILIGVFLWTR